MVGYAEKQPSCIFNVDKYTKNLSLMFLIRQIVILFTLLITLGKWTTKIIKIERLIIRRLKVYIRIFNFIAIACEFLS